MEHKLYQKWINLLTRNGKKAIAYRITQQAFFLFKNLLKAEYTEYSLGKKNRLHILPNSLLEQKSTTLLEKAVQLVRPSLETRKVRVSGRTIPVPAIIPEERSYSLALSWMIQSAKKRQHTKRREFHQKKGWISSHCMSFSHSLAYELFDIFKKPLKKINSSQCALSLKEEQHRSALNHRAFYHYRWWKR